MLRTLSFSLSCVLVLLLVPLLVIISPQVLAATVYISDTLTVPLRSGPSGSHRILNQGLPSGTILEVISVDEEAGFTQIKNQRGTQGWVRTQYLVNSPVAKVRLQQANRRITRLEKSLSEAEAKIKQLDSTSKTQRSANNAATDKIASLEEEFGQIQRVSSSAIETHEENLRLKDTNARLTDELNDIGAARDTLAANEANQGIMLGAGFILVGLLFGVLIKARPHRSAWS